MSNKTLNQKVNECIQIMNTVAVNNPILDKTYKIINKAIEIGVFKYKYYAKDPCENYEKSNDAFLRKVDGLKAIYANLYWNKYLYPTLNGMKYYFTTEAVDEYIETLRLKENYNTRFDSFIDFFECLTSYNKEFITGVLKNIECDIITYSSLLDSIKTNNQSEFIKIIKENNLNLEEAIKICSSHETIFNEDLHINYSVDEYIHDPQMEKCIDIFTNSIDLMISDGNQNDVTDFDSLDYFTEIIDILLEYFATNYKKIIEQVELTFIIFINLNKAITNKMYDKFMNKLTGSEFEYFNKLFIYLHNSFINNTPPEIPFTLYGSISNTIYEKHYSNNKIKFNENSLPLANESHKENKSTNVELNLPDDLFINDKYKKGCIEEEFYSITINLEIGKSPEKLAKLINELAYQGYIDNNLETKLLFVYRLTGRLRPDKLRKITWYSKGVSKRGCELLYIIQIVTNKRGKYKMTEEFFEGPEWGINPNQSGKDATKGFKSYLHDLFPNDFPAYVPKGKK